MKTYKWCAVLSLSLSACSSTARSFGDKSDAAREGGAGSAQAGSAGAGTGGKSGSAGTGGNSGSSGTGSSGQAGDVNSAGQAGETADAGIDAPDTEAASDSPTALCTAQEAFAWSALPSSFVWQSWSAAGGFVWSCVSEPCGSCTIAWSEISGTDWDSTGTRVSLVAGFQCSIPIHEVDGAGLVIGTCTMNGTGAPTVVLTVGSTSSGYEVHDVGAAPYYYFSLSGSCGQGYESSLRASLFAALKQALLGVTFACPNG